MNTFQIIALTVSACIMLTIVIVNIYWYKKGRFVKKDIQPTIADELHDMASVDEYIRKIPLRPVEPEKEPVELLVDDAKVAENFNWVALREWYYKNAKTHAKSLKSTYNYIRVFFIIQGCVMLFSFSFSMSTSEEFDKVLIWVSLIPYVLMFGSYLNLASKKVENVISSARYVQLREDQFKKIWSSCYTFMSKMNLQYALKIYYVKIDSFEASVVLEDEVVYLFLSRNLISYSHNHYEDVEAIIGHEFGHVVQGDTRMMIVTRKAVEIPAIIGTISAIITAVMMIGALLAGKELVEVSLSAMLVVNYWQLVFLRRSAEHLSDMASLAFTEKTTIRSIIEKYIPEKRTLQYPSKSQRLMFINKLLNKYTVSKKEERA